jgi:hypothetical protein
VSDEVGRNPKKRPTPPEGEHAMVVQRAHHIPQRSPVNEVGHDVDDADSSP